MRILFFVFALFCFSNSQTLAQYGEFKMPRTEDTPPMEVGSSLYSRVVLPTDGEHIKEMDFDQLKELLNVKTTPIKPYRGDSTGRAIKEAENKLKSMISIVAEQAATNRDDIAENKELAESNKANIDSLTNRFNSVMGQVGTFDRQFAKAKEMVETIDSTVSEGVKKALAQTKRKAKSVRKASKTSVLKTPQRSRSQTNVYTPQPTPSVATSYPQGVRVVGTSYQNSNGFNSPFKRTNLNPPVARYVPIQKTYSPAPVYKPVYSHVPTTTYTHVQSVPSCNSCWSRR